MNTERVTKNLVYLAKNITNVTEILLHLKQEEIISQDEKEKIDSEKTTLDKNSKLLEILQKKDLDLETFLKILRATENNNCVKKIEESPITSEMGIVGKSKSRKRKNASKHVGHQKVLKNIWWPDKKLLIESLYKRKIGDKLFVEKLHEIISTGKNRRAVICESAAASKLTGLGGVGKTLTANWYVHEYEKEYQHVIWIDCGEKSLLTSFQKLARDLDIKHLDKLIDLEDYSRKSYEALEDFKCLWVFDNAENYRGDEGIKDVLPKFKENFYCLITSRSREWGTENIGYGNIDRFELNIFEEIESVKFFKGNLIPEIEYTDSQLKQLCLLLGNLPLAMQLAVAALNKRNIDLQDYIEKTCAKDLGNIVDTKFDDYEKTISGSVQITLELIAKEEGRNIAKEILNVFGYIQPDEVDIDFLKTILGYPIGYFWSEELNEETNTSDSEIMKAVELLTEYSLITKIESVEWNGRSIVLSIHRLLQQVIRHHGRKTEKETLRKILGCDEFLDYKLIPFIKYADEDLRQEFPKVKAELIDQRQLEKLLMWNRLEEAVQVAKLIDEEMGTNTTKFNYAMCLTKNGFWTEAHRYLEELSKEEMEERNSRSRYLMTKGVLELREEVTKELVDSILLVADWKTGNRRRSQETLLKRKHFIVIVNAQDALNAFLEILCSNLFISNYYLIVYNSTTTFDYEFNRDRKEAELRVSDVLLDLSIVPRTVQRLVLTRSEVVASGEINLPSLKYLKVDLTYPLSASLFFSTVQLQEIEVSSVSSVDLSTLPSTVQKLSVCTITKVVASGEIDLPDLKYLKLVAMSPLCLSLLTPVQLNELEIEYFHFFDCPLDFSIVPPSVQKIFLKKTEVVMRGQIDLPNLRYLKLESMSSLCLSFLSSVQLEEIEIKDSTSLDISMVPSSVQKLSLSTISNIQKTGIIELPNLKYLKLDGKFPSSSFWSAFKPVQLNELKLENLDSPLDLCILPPTIEKLSLKSTKVVGTGGIPDLPNLRYLKLESMFPSCLLLLSNIQLTEIHLWNVSPTLDLCIVPPTVQKLYLFRLFDVVVGPKNIYLPNLKFLKLQYMCSGWPLFRSVIYTDIDILIHTTELNMEILPQNITNFNLRSKRELRQLEILVIVEDFTVKNVTEALSVFHPMQLVLHQPTFESASFLIELMKKQIPTIAVGRFEFQTESFDNSIISKHVDRLAEYYLFEGGTGKAMEKQDFEKLLELFRIDEI